MKFNTSQPGVAYLHPLSIPLSILLSFLTFLGGIESNTGL